MNHVLDGGPDPLLEKGHFLEKWSVAMKRIDRIRLRRKATGLFILMIFVSLITIIMLRRTSERHLAMLRSVSYP